MHSNFIIGSYRPELLVMPIFNLNNSKILNNFISNKSKYINLYNSVYSNHITKQISTVFKTQKHFSQIFKPLQAKYESKSSSITDVSDFITLRVTFTNLCVENLIGFTNKQMCSIMCCLPS